jgi:hypothetical protein
MKKYNSMSNTMLVHRSKRKALERKREEEERAEISHWMNPMLHLG